MAFLISYNQRELQWDPAPKSIQHALLQKEQAKYSTTPEATILLQKFDSRYAFFYLAQYTIRQKLQAKLLTKHPLIVMQFAVKGGYSIFHHQKQEIKEGYCQLVYYPAGYELPFEIGENLVLMLLECRPEIMERLFPIEPRLKKYTQAAEEQSKELLCSIEYPINFDLLRSLEQFMRLKTADQNELDFSTEKFLGTILSQFYKALREFSQIRKMETEKELKFQEIKLFIEANLKDDLKVETLCRKFGLSADVLQQLAYQALGTSIGYFIINCRLEKAAEILSDPSEYGLKIKDICYMVGYSDYSNFSKSFKNKFKLNPRAFKKEKLQKLDLTK